jgi:hypothetical protein
MTTPAARRLAKERQAADLIETHHGDLQFLLVQVTQDIGAELTSLPQIQRDARLALEMAYRLDQAIDFPSPLMEAADFFIFYLASLGIIGIVRAIERAMKRKKETLLKLQKRIDERGPQMAKATKRRIERRITRIERAVSRANH